MLMDPVGRASRWRFNSSAPTNWNDNELFCGGFGVHHQTNGKKVRSIDNANKKYI